LALLKKHSALKLYIIAGEASGDLHGSNLIKALKSHRPSLDIRAWGGDLMQSAGADVVKHYRDLAFMGFYEVLINIKTILRNIRFCKEDITAFRPDALILIDYPGFNLRIAKWAHEIGIPVLYYIAPQVWAWKENRIHAMKKHIQHLFVVLPFEKLYFENHNMPVTFVGHPLLDQISGSSETRQEFQQRNKLSDKPIIALLPGSRKQEIRTMLPIMLDMTNHFPQYQFIVAGAPSQNESFYRSVAQHQSMTVLFGQTSEILRHAAAGLITSGTATLEAGIYKVPQVVCYKGSPISYAIAKQLVKIKYISLVNLILDKPAVTELIQHDLNNAKLKAELDSLLNEASRREQIQQDYLELHDSLGGSGASERTAIAMLKILESGK
jgi:lipid-A-disaccharide synthase